MNAEEFLTVEETAALLGVSEDTVRRLFDAGELTGMRTRVGRGGWRKISRASAQAYRRAQRGENEEASDA
jgi:excisionase family DNA binding protein